MKEKELQTYIHAIEDIYKPRAYNRKKMYKAVKEKSKSFDTSLQVLDLIKDDKDSALALLRYLFEYKVALPLLNEADRVGAKELQYYWVSKMSAFLAAEECPPPIAKFLTNELLDAWFVEDKKTTEMRNKAKRRVVYG